MDDMQQLLMRVLFEVTESRIEMRQEFASFRKEVDQRFDRVETRLDNVEERVGKLETTVETLASDMKAMDAKIESMDSTIKAMDANMKAMDEKNHQRFIQVHEHIDRVDQARVEGEERIMKAIDLILDGSGLGRQIVKKPTIVRG